jgi:hypothetical protein
MTLVLLVLILWAIVGSLVAFAFAKVAGPC